MKGFIILNVVFAFTFCHVQMGLAQKVLSFKPGKPVICYYSNENRPDHVEVSEKFKRLRQNPSGRAKTAIIEVEYINFPADNLAKTAFQYAVDIWESELTSTIPIKVRAEWTSLGANVLGQALWGRAFANFDGAQHINTFYPVALAEKIARKQLNDPTEPDIVASFSSNAAWYYGTNGVTPSGQMDLVTIVLHEIAHGLGFSDTYDVEGAQGSVGLASGEFPVPFIFDLFVENASNNKLFHTFDSPSNALGSELQNTSLFFNSPLSVDVLNGTKPKLFAPSTFDGGSSISHLDEATFSVAGDANRLMTPHIAKAESIHNPGSVLLAMLSDMGWVYTHIEHDQIKDTEIKNGQPFLITVLIRSDNGYDNSQVKLHFSNDGINYTVVSMTATGTANQFQASIPGTTVNRGYAYFISVHDNLERVFTNPGKIQTQGEEPEQGTFFFNVGPDLATPEITHEPVAFILEDDESLELTAVVTDNMEVQEVMVEYFFNEGPVQTAMMQEINGTDEFTASIALPVLIAGAEIKYRIVARDAAVNENITILPEEDYYTILVTGIMPVQNSYTNDFNVPSNDFFGNNFSIATPAGFNDGAIHTTHPYPNGSDVNEESNYTYQLQIPILLDDANPYIRFDEIVLVEPGEDDAEFGDGTFYDYVVVEGSSNGGATWKPFTAGYDSRAEPAWLTHYNSNMVNDNSEAKGSQSLYRERTINMLEEGKFSAGDEVLIRFRLFSDALAHGWGWAIDNVSIQGPVTDVEQPFSSVFQVYPVPVKDDLYVRLLYPQTKQVKIQISDMQGRIIYFRQTMITSGAVEEGIDVRSMNEGMYILKATMENKIYTRKFIKVAH